MVNTIIEYIDPIQVKKVIDTEIYELSDDNKAYDYIRPVSISFTNVRDNYYKYYNTNYNVTWDYTLNATDPINVKDVNVAIYYYKSGSADNLSVVTAFAPLDSKSTQWTLPNMVETGSYYFQMDIDYASEIFTIISDEFKVIEPVNPVLKMNTGSMMLTASYNSLYKVDFVVDKYNSDILDSVDVYYTTDGDYVRYTKLNNSPITLNPGNVTQSYSEWVIPTDMMPFRLKVSGKSKIDSTEIFVEYPKFGESKIPIVQESFDRFLRILDIGTYIDKYSTPPIYSSSVASPGLGGFVQFVFHKSHQLRDTIDIYVRLDDSENIWTPVKLECALYNHIVNPKSNDFFTGSVDIDFNESILYPDSGEVRFKIETRTVDSNINEPPNVVLYYNAVYKVANEVIPPIKIQNVIQTAYTQNGVTITPVPNIIYYDLTSSLVNIPWETNENSSDIYAEDVDLYYSTDNPPTNYIAMDTAIRFYSGGTTSTTIASGSYNWMLPNDIGIIPTASLKLVVKEKRTGKEIIATKKVHILKYDQGYHDVSDLSVVNLTQTALQRPKKFDNTVLYYGDDVQLKFKRHGQYLSGSKIEILVDDPSLDIVTNTHTKMVDSYGHPTYKISGLNPVWETPEYLLDGTYVGIPAGGLEYPLPIKIRVSDVNKFTLETYEQIYYGQLNKRNIIVDVGDVKDVYSDTKDKLKISWYGDGLSKTFNINLVSGSLVHSIVTNKEFSTPNLSYEFDVKNIPIEFDKSECMIIVESIKPAHVNYNVDMPIGMSKPFTMHVYDLNVSDLSIIPHPTIIGTNVVNDMGWRAILGFLLWSIEEILKYQSGTSNYQYIKSMLGNINIIELKIRRDVAWNSVRSIVNEYDSNGNLTALVQNQYKTIFDDVFDIMSNIYTNVVLNDAGKYFFNMWFNRACQINSGVDINTFKKDDDFYVINPNYLHTNNYFIEIYKFLENLKTHSGYQIIDTLTTSGSLSNRIDEFTSEVGAVPIGEYLQKFTPSGTEYSNTKSKALGILNTISSNSGDDVFIVGNNIQKSANLFNNHNNYTLDLKCADMIAVSYEILKSEGIRNLYNASNYSNVPTWITYIDTVCDSILNVLPTISTDFQTRLEYAGNSTSSVAHQLTSVTQNFDGYKSMYYKYVNNNRSDIQSMVKSSFYTDKFKGWVSQISPELNTKLDYISLIDSDVKQSEDITVTSIQSNLDYHFDAMLRMLYYFAKSIEKRQGTVDFKPFYETVINTLEQNNFRITAEQFRNIVEVKNRYFSELVDDGILQDYTPFRSKTTILKLLRYVDYFVSMEYAGKKYTLFEITSKIRDIFCGINKKAPFNSDDLRTQFIQNSDNSYSRIIFKKLVTITMLNEFQSNVSLSYDDAVEYFIKRDMTEIQKQNADRLLFYPEIQSHLMAYIHILFENGQVYPNLHEFYGSGTEAAKFVEFFQSVVIGQYKYNYMIPTYDILYWEIA